MCVFGPDGAVFMVVWYLRLICQEHLFHHHSLYSMETILDTNTITLHSANNRWNFLFWNIRMRKYRNGCYCKTIVLYHQKNMLSWVNLLYFVSKTMFYISIRKYYIYVMKNMKMYYPRENNWKVLKFQFFTFWKVHFFNPWRFQKLFDIGNLNSTDIERMTKCF